MEARQQEIADLARHVLPFVEAQEQKEKLIKVVHQVLILALTAIIAFSSSQCLRPISSSEEKTLDILLEHRTMMNRTAIKPEMQAFLDDMGLKRLSDMRAYQWNDALYRLTREPP